MLLLLPRAAQRFFPAIWQGALIGIVFSQVDLARKEHLVGDALVGVVVKQQPSLERLRQAVAKLQMPGDLDSTTHRHQLPNEKVNLRNNGGFVVDDDLAI